MLAAQDEDQAQQVEQHLEVGAQMSQLLKEQCLEAEASESQTLKERPQEAVALMQMVEKPESFEEDQWV